MTPFQLFGPLFLLQNTPLWPFAMLLVPLVAVHVRFRHRPAMRKVTLVFTLLTLLAAVPPCAVQAYFQMGGEAALQRRFSRVFDTGCVAKYRFVIAGLGDTQEFWKLKNVGARTYRKIVDRYSLQPTLVEDAASLNPYNLPWWWPDGIQDYTVFQGNDGTEGSVEVWVARNESTVYLYRFIE